MYFLPLCRTTFLENNTNPKIQTPSLLLLSNTWVKTEKVLHPSLLESKGHIVTQGAGSVQQVRGHKPKTKGTELVPWVWLAGWGHRATPDLFNPEECCRAGACIVPASLRSPGRASGECWTVSVPEGFSFHPPEKNLLFLPLILFLFRSSSSDFIKQKVSTGPKVRLKCTRH